jgi:tripartite-type tricarboxylate transporter receptor subunit TctC
MRTGANHRSLPRCLTTLVAGTLASLTLATVAQAQNAQAWPAKPVKVIAAYPTGSGPDSVLRVLGDKLNKLWGQQIIIENKPTANGLVAGEAARNSPADGYTLLMFDDAHINANPRLYKKMPFDIQRDLEPVARLYQTYFFFVVKSDSPWKTIPDLIAAAKARGDKMTYGSWGIGSVGHLAVVGFENLTGTEMTHVPFQGVTLLYPAIGNGEVDWGFGTVASSGAVARAGKIRYLAAAAPKRVVGYPDIPTIGEAGGSPDFEVRAWVALLAPRGVPAPIIAKINADVNRTLADPDVRERLATMGFEPYPGTTADLAQSIEIGGKRMAGLIERAKVSLD